MKEELIDIKALLQKLENLDFFVVVVVWQFAVLSGTCLCLMVWVNAFECGEFPDLKIARIEYIHHVGFNEMTIADKGYQDGRYFVTRWQVTSKQFVRARHETVNKRLKDFKVLRIPFRHNLNDHKFCFYAIANLTQLKIGYGEPLFEIYELL